MYRGFIGIFRYIGIFILLEALQRAPAIRIFIDAVLTLLLFFIGELGCRNPTVLCCDILESRFVSRIMLRRS